MKHPVKCRHFNGIIHNQCKAGIIYANVRDSASSPYKFPCFEDHGVAERCASVSYFTAEERQAAEDEINAVVKRALERFARWECMHCGTPVQEERQVGRCFYAVPCGCRQGQGKGRGKRPEGI